MRGLIVSKRVLRYADRDIVRVDLPCGTRHGFYRSSGRNSGMPGVWLPFDGISTTGFRSWFEKSRFCEHVPAPLTRYGCTFLKLVSEALGRRRIPRGRRATPSKVNEFLAFAWARQIAERNSVAFQNRVATRREVDTFLGLRKRK